MLTVSSYNRGYEKIIIGLCGALAAIFAVHLFSDEALNPEAAQWLEYFSKPADLEQNAYIELMALGIDHKKSYQIAKLNYLAAAIDSI